MSNEENNQPQPQRQRHTMQPLQAWRRQRGLTQFQLAVRAGVGLGTITGIEALRQSPTINMAMTLARALGVSVEEIQWPTAEELRTHRRKGRATAPVSRTAA